MSVIINASEFDSGREAVYLNGVLQHSDKRHSDRHRRDHYSGELNYVLIRNALLLPTIHDLLATHAYLISVLNPANLGSM